MKTSTKLVILVLTSITLNIGPRTLNCYANKLTIGSLTIDQAAQTIQIKVAWENSWRFNSSTLPYNWDAAWIFVKFRDCSSDPQTTQFTQGIVSTTLTDHNWDVLGDGQRFEATKADGTAGIDVATNNTGVMLRPNTEGTFAQISDTILLKITNLPTSGTYDIRVFGIEMVFVPSSGGGFSSFNVGDGNGVTFSTNALGQPFPVGEATPLTISSEAAIIVNSTSNISSCCNNGSSSTVQAGFPKGFNSFYIMKYEITQGQYADFLNSVSEDMATNTLWTGTYNQFRHMINNTGTAPQKYSTTRVDRACNYLSWSRVSAYLDWACLRPLTEMQYEKAGRGFAAKLLNEFAWGTTSITYPAAGGISGAENGTETITTANANANGNAVAWSSGDGGGIRGPLRAGIFATATSTRQLSGGSYFGAMELTGNVREFYIGICAGDAGGEVCASGISLGDGTLAATGYHNTADWPSGSAPADGHVVVRGGSWNAVTYLSDRNNGNPCVVTQDNTIGGRGGR
ncbi:MAG: SUMF1/EgtB/PvdO family nonheme iron enzyme [Bacteroidetes bacterium]|nr:SUMF1/EgtB/PvdO family nonheme iron enzyme [Bacteroidota bacterium]